MYYSYTFYQLQDLKSAKSPVVSNSHHAQEFASGAYHYGYK